MKKCVVLMGFAVGAVLAATPALADKAAYCQAYARDFSDARASAKAEWQHKYEIALDACLGGPKKSAAAKPVDAAKPAAEKQLASAAAPAVAKPVADEAAAKPEAAAAKPAADETKMMAGTAEWNDYCAKKYTSFNPKTGMYLSHTGVNRRCLVTKS